MLIADIFQFQKMEFCGPWLGRIGCHVFHRHTNGRHFYCSTPVLLSHHDLPHRDVETTEKTEAAHFSFLGERGYLLFAVRECSLSVLENLCCWLLFFLLKNIFSS